MAKIEAADAFHGLHPVFGHTGNLKPRFHYALLPCGAGIVWATVAVLSDQPLGIVAGGEAAEAGRVPSSGVGGRQGRAGA